MTATYTTAKTGRHTVANRADTAVAEAMLRDMAYVLSLTRKVRESIENESGRQPVAVAASVRNGERSLV